MARRKLDQEQKSAPALAVFDVDRTITRHGTWTPFVVRTLRAHPKLWFAFPFHVLGFILRTLIGRGGRDAYKKMCLRAVFSKLSEGQAQAATTRFLDKLVESGLRPGAIDMLVQRRKAGDRIILATAAMDFYIVPLAARLGGAEVVATRTLYGTDGHIIPELDGGNCYGPKKLERLTQRLSGGRRPPFIRAYSDDKSDFDMLAWADAGYVVNPKKKIIEKAQASGFTVVDWNFGAKDAPITAPGAPRANSKKDIFQ